jgi:hypothetical protein
MLDVALIFLVAAAFFICHRCYFFVSPFSKMAPSSPARRVHVIKNCAAHVTKKCAARSILIGWPAARGESFFTSVRQG